MPVSIWMVYGLLADHQGLIEQNLLYFLADYVEYLGSEVDITRYAVFLPVRFLS